MNKLILSLAALAALGAAQSVRGHESLPAALMDSLHECRNTGTYARMECADAVILQPDGLYRTTPITVGTEQTFKLHISLAPGERIICLFHTHPGKDGRADTFSDIDVRVAEKLGVPSYIFVLRLGQMRIYRPQGRILASADVSNPGSLAP